MTLTVTKDLPEVGLIGNPMILELQSDNMFSAAGSQAVIELRFTVIDIVVGHEITLLWNNLEITFTLAVSPDGSGNQIRAATGGQSLDDWLDIFGEDLYKNYYISRDFDYEVDKPNKKIVLTAKEKGIDYNVTTGDITITGLTTNSTNGSDQVVRDNYNLLVKTFLKVGADYDLLNEDRIQPDSSGKAEFDLHDIFSSQLTPEFKWPEESSPLYFQRSNNIKKYLIKYAEVYESAVKKLFTYSGTVYAILGAFDYKMLAGLNGTSYSFLDFIITFKSFLTWQPVIKIINKTQTEKLYFLVYEDFSGGMTLKLKIYYTDGSDTTKNAIVIDGVSKYDVFELLVGYATLNVEQYSGTKTVEKYQVWIENDAAAAKSHVRTFIVDTNSYRNERVFLFRNSFGAFDTFRATGRKRNYNQYERLVLEKNDQDITVHEQYLALETSIFKTNSGWISSATRNWLREIFLSKEVYEIINDYKFPILIQDKKRNLFDDNSDQHHAEINYKYAFKDHAYSNEIDKQALLAETGEVLKSEDGEILYT